MDKRGECYQCRHFDRYYLHEDCENYRAKRWHRRDETFLRFCLNDLLTEISELRSMLEAERNEE